MRTLVFLALCLIAIATNIFATATVDDKLQQYIHSHTNQTNSIGLIHIDSRSEEISQGTWLYVKKALDHYKELKPIFIILKLNTPGGEVFSAEEISDALKDFDTQNGIPIIAYIDNWAMSAGAMLAYSCRFIAVSKDASMGAAAPIVSSPTGETTEASEKIVSALRSDFASRASFFGRNPYIAEAMVDKDIILVERDGKFIILENESQIRLTEPNSDIVISTKGKLLTLTADQLLAYGVADFEVPTVRTELITDEERELGQWPASKMDFFYYPFFANIPHAVIDSYRMDWKTQFFVLLATPIVSSILVLGLMIGGYIELTTPGFGVAGTIAVTCLLLLILSSFANDVANWLELILLLIGIGLLIIDLFLLPTFGLLGIVGLLFFLAGLGGMLLPGIGSVNFDMTNKTWNAATHVFLERLTWFCGTIVVGVLVIALLSRYIAPSLHPFRRLVLTGSEQVGYVAGANHTKLPKPGTKAEVFATLRPAGKIIIGDDIYDAVSDGSFIEKGTTVAVIRLEGSVIVVERV